MILNDAREYLRDGKSGQADLLLSFANDRRQALEQNGVLTEEKRTRLQEEAESIYRTIHPED